MKTPSLTSEIARLPCYTHNKSFTHREAENETMANSEFQYVRSFEKDDSLLPATWIVVRIDGRGFSKLCKKYEFGKPNDKRGIALMNAAAVRQLSLSRPAVALRLRSEVWAAAKR